MTTEDAIREMAFRSRQSLRAISEKTGRTPNFIGATLSRGSVPKADTLAEIARACSYRLALVPDSEPLPGGSLEIGEC